MQSPLKIVIPILALALSLSACANQSTHTSPDTGGAEQPDDRLTQTTLAGHFTGILPCVDCSGWEAQLELFADGTFQLAEHSLDEHEPRLIQATGTWTLLDDGPIPFISLQLQDRADEIRYYEVISRQQLYFVGLEKESVKSELDYSLTRVNTP